MDLLKIKRSRIRKMFWFRIGILLLSVIGIISYLLGPSLGVWLVTNEFCKSDSLFEIDDFIQTVLLGVFSSGLVWAVVELVDYTLSIYNDYMNEYLLFSKGMQEEERLLQAYFKGQNNLESIDWTGIHAL